MTTFGSDKSLHDGNDRVLRDIQPMADSVRMLLIDD